MEQFYASFGKFDKFEFFWRRWIHWWHDIHPWAGTFLTEFPLGWLHDECLYQEHIDQHLALPHTVQSDRAFAHHNETTELVPQQSSWRPKLLILEWVYTPVYCVISQFFTLLYVEHSWKSKWKLTGHRFLKHIFEQLAERIILNSLLDSTNSNHSLLL